MSFRINPTTVFSPLNSASGVSINLAELTFQFSIQEFIGEPVNAWGVIAGTTYISSVTDKTLVESPNISQGSLSAALIPSPPPNSWGCIITIPISSALEYDTEYTWRVDVSINYNVLAGSGSTSFSSSTVTFTTEASPTRQINLSSPANTATGIILQPLLQWSIGGDGAQDGDLLDVYFKKNDSSFGPADLLGGLVDATLNSSWQIVGGLDYNATYYWQIQAAASAGGYGTLLSSTIWSFTTTTFRPPAVSIGSGGADDFTGVNNMLTKKRFIAAANNKIWYEDL